MEAIEQKFQRRGFLAIVGAGAGYVAMGGAAGWLSRARADATCSMIF